MSEEDQYTVRVMNQLQYIWPSLVTLLSARDGKITTDNLFRSVMQVVAGIDHTKNAQYTRFMAWCLVHSAHPFERFLVGVNDTTFFRESLEDVTLPGAKENVEETKEEKKDLDYVPDDSDLGSESEDEKDEEEEKKIEKEDRKAREKLEAGGEAGGEEEEKEEEAEPDTEKKRVQTRGNDTNRQIAILPALQSALISTVVSVLYNRNHVQTEAVNAMYHAFRRLGVLQARRKHFDIAIDPPPGTLTREMIGGLLSRINEVMQGVRSNSTVGALMAHGMSPPLVTLRKRQPHLFILDDHEPFELTQLHLDNEGAMVLKDIIPGSLRRVSSTNIRGKIEDDEGDAAAVYELVTKGIRAKQLQAITEATNELGTRAEVVTQTLVWQRYLEQAVIRGILRLADQVSSDDAFSFLYQIWESLRLVEAGRKAGSMAWESLSYDDFDEYTHMAAAAPRVVARGEYRYRLVKLENIPSVAEKALVGGLIAEPTKEEDPQAQHAVFDSEWEPENDELLRRLLVQILSSRMDALVYRRTTCTLRSALRFFTGNGLDEVPGGSLLTLDDEQKKNFGRYFKLRDFDRDDRRAKGELLGIKKWLLDNRHRATELVLVFPSVGGEDKDSSWFVAVTMRLKRGDNADNREDPFVPEENGGYLDTKSGRDKVLVERAFPRAILMWSGHARQEYSDDINDMRLEVSTETSLASVFNSTRFRDRPVVIYASAVAEDKAVQYLPVRFFRDIPFGKVRYAYQVEEDEEDLKKGLRPWDLVEEEGLQSITPNAQNFGLVAPQEQLEVPIMMHRVHFLEGLKGFAQQLGHVYSLFRELSHFVVLHRGLVAASETILEPDVDLLMRREFGLSGGNAPLLEEWLRAGVFLLSALYELIASVRGGIPGTIPHTHLGDLGDQGARVVYMSKVCLLSLKSKIKEDDDEEVRDNEPVLKKPRVDKVEGLLQACLAERGRNVEERAKAVFGFENALLLSHATGRRVYSFIVKAEAVQVRVASPGVKVVRYEVKDISWKNLFPVSVRMAIGEHAWPPHWGVDIGVVSHGGEGDDAFLLRSPAVNGLHLQSRWSDVMLEDVDETLGGGTEIEIIEVSSDSDDDSGKKRGRESDQEEGEEEEEGEGEEEHPKKKARVKKKKARENARWVGEMVFGHNPKAALASEEFGLVTPVTLQNTTTAPKGYFKDGNKEKYYVTITRSVHFEGHLNDIEKYLIQSIGAVDLILRDATASVGKALRKSEESLESVSEDLLKRWMEFMLVPGGKIPFFQGEAPDKLLDPRQADEGVIASGYRPGAMEDYLGDAAKDFQRIQEAMDASSTTDPVPVSVSDPASASASASDSDSDSDYGSGSGSGSASDSSSASGSGSGSDSSSASGSGSASDSSSASGSDSSSASGSDSDSD